jgi:hypothetical protein
MCAPSPSLFQGRRLAQGGVHWVDSYLPTDLVGEGDSESTWTPPSQNRLGRIVHPLESPPLCGSMQPGRWCPSEPSPSRPFRLFLNAQNFLKPSANILDPSGTFHKCLKTFCITYEHMPDTSGIVRYFPNNIRNHFLLYIQSEYSKCR